MPWQHTHVTNQNYIIIMGSSSFARYKLMPFNNYCAIMDKFGKRNSLLNAKVKTKEMVQVFKDNE